jgi:hypothetical protein
MINDLKSRGWLLLAAMCVGLISLGCDADFDFRGTSESGVRRPKPILKPKVKKFEYIGYEELEKESLTPVDHKYSPAMPESKTP